MLHCLDSLISRLSALQSKAESLSLAELLRETNVSYEQIKPVCRFSDNGYQRHKLSGTEWYDLWAICWKAGQSSLIHDHMHSSCAFRVITGCATELLYVPVSESTVRFSGRRFYEPGTLCVAQEQDIHRISNDAETDPMVTLHIYSPPLKMKTYELES